MSLLINILMWICPVCLLFCLCAVVQYYMKYTGLSLGPSPHILFVDLLLIVRGASSQSLQERNKYCGIWYVFEEVNFFEASNIVF